MRKPVGITYNNDGNMVVICDDGSTHVMLSSANASMFDKPPGWLPGKPIPGTEESPEMMSLRKIKEAWHHYWYKTEQNNSDVDMFFNSVRDALEIF